MPITTLCFLMATCVLLDGLQGPVYVGTGTMFRRFALYGLLVIPLDATTVAEAVSAISCWYEDKTEWGDRVGWIYGSVTEDVDDGVQDAQPWMALSLLHYLSVTHFGVQLRLISQIDSIKCLRWATGSVEIFFSRNNAFLASMRLKLLQRLAYINVGVYPFTSIFLIVYCFLPALSLFTGQFIVANLNITFLIYLLTNYHMPYISGPSWSAHLAAVVQGLLKVIAGIEISFTLTSSLQRGLCIKSLSGPKFIGGAFFSFWVLAHLYPFAKGLMGRRGKTPTSCLFGQGLIANYTFLALGRV
ncbi:hypothetical protein L3X38_044467 [Prunus dulcis]|uniref:Uncharacterized protein n=1 Tax=Prunus dulcis TaxID=3755 RepID=A0AAD4YN49_PRUDU|nr:hypothetical protein L3X38_044467 [Prunus dulcis]